MKLKELKINSFRGIPSEVSMNLSDKNKKPSSAIIFGDNGSGKSSIIDAIEFLLQNRIDRTVTLLNPLRPNVLNLNNSAEAVIECVFEDSSIYTRSITPQYSEKDETVHPIRSHNEMHRDFQISPIVLRRSDIIKYMQVPIQSKQLLFWSFIYNLKLKKEEILKFDSVQSQNILDKRLSLKNVRRSLLDELSNKLNLDKSLIPVQKKPLDDFISKYVTKGYKIKTILNSKNTFKGVRYDLIPIVKEIYKNAQEISNSNRDVRKIKEKIVYEDNSNERKKELVKFLENSSNFLTTSFKEISNLKFVDRIELKGGMLSEISLDIDVYLINGKKVSPTSVFSEANLDLLILLLYVSIIMESSKSGQSKLLILDDVLQSVDSTIRLNYLDYLLTHFSDWQIIITAHDRLWLNQLRTTFQRHGHKFKEFEIRSWDFKFGPKLLEINSMGCQMIDYNKLLEDPPLLAAKIGLTLESVCHQLSVELGTSIQRKKDDRYTLGDLWPGVFKSLKKTNIIQVVQSIDKLIHIRNVLGAHYNEWAISLSNHELVDFAVNTNALLSAVFCNNCFKWVNRMGVCSCEKLNIMKSNV